MEKRVRELENALAERDMILDTMQEMAAFHDTQLRVQWANRAAAASVGADFRDLMGRHCHEIWQQRDAPCEGCPVLDAIQTGRCQEAEIATPDGRIFHLRGHPVFDDTGAVIGAVEYGFDITERKQAENALRESESQFRAMFESTDDFVFLKNLDLRYVKVNPATEALFGKAAHELIGKTDIELFGQASAQIIHAHDQRVLAGERIDIEDNKPVDGQMHCFHVKKAPIHDAHGNITGLCGISRDITERKQAEKDLLENRNKYRTLFESANDAIFVACAATGIILDANHEAERLIGRPRSQIIGMHQTELHPKEQEIYAKTAFKEDARRQVDIFYDDFIVLHANGRQIPVEISSSFIEIQGRSCFLGVFRDVSAQRETEAALRRNQKMLARTERIANIGSWEWDIGVDAVTWSDGLFHIFKMTPGEKAPTWAEHQDLYHPEDMERLRRAVEKAVADGAPYEVTLRALRKDGEIRHCLARGLVQRGEEGHPERLYGSLQDITELKLAELALQQKQTMLTHTERMANIGSWEWELATDTVVWSDQLYRILGLDSQKDAPILGEHRDRFHPQDFEALVQTMNKSIKEGAFFEMELRVPSPAGETRVGVARGFVETDAEGRAVRLFGSMQDITARKQARKNLQKALAEKEVLLREIHHRVKNNMQVITSLLRMHSRKNPEPELKTFFDNCRSRIEAMSLIHESLYQSKDLAFIDFKTYLQKLCRSLGRVHDLREQGIQVKIGQCHVNLDMDQGVALGMVTAELISNAFKHAFPPDKPGKVCVHMEQSDAGTVELIVADDGKGLPPDFDLSNTRSLGMRLVTGAVTRELRGHIQAQNDGGAKFIIRFDCQER